MQVTVKGCRSEVKVYTDLSVGVKGVSGAFGIGLTPTLGLVCLPKLDRTMRHEAPQCYCAVVHCALCTVPAISVPRPA